MRSTYIRYGGRAYYTVKKTKYGFWHLLFDFALTLLTGGVWLIWILIRYLRTH